MRFNTATLEQLAVAYQESQYEPIGNDVFHPPSRTAPKILCTAKLSTGHGTVQRMITVKMSTLCLAVCARI